MLNVVEKDVTEFALQLVWKPKSTKLIVLHDMKQLLFINDLLTTVR